MVDKQHPWEAEFRPTKLKDVLGTEPLLEKLQTFISGKSIPNLYFVGEPGTGKTTVAKILANEIAGKGEYLYISASDKNDINTMRTEVKEYCYTAGIDHLKIVVLDEADFLTAQAQAMLRHTTEDFQEHCRFILTANYDNKIIKPLKSRFQKFIFEKAPIAEVWKRCAKILKRKGIDLTNDVKNDLKELVKYFHPDIRSTINNMQKFTNDKIFQFNTKMVKNETHEILIKLLKDGKIGEIRKDCLKGINEYDTLYRVLFDNVKGLTDDVCKISQIIIIIANYQYMHSLVTDAEINFIACLFEIFNIVRE